MSVSDSTLTVVAMHLCCIAAIVGSLWVADFQLSACAVISSWLQMFSLGLRAAQLVSGGGGVSKRALTLELMSIGCRLSSTMVKNGYLPIDATGDFMYQSVDMCSFAIALLLRQWPSRRQRQCSHADFDSKMSNMPVLLLALLVASLCHGCENASPIFDTLWLTGVFLGLFASIPQRLLAEQLFDRVPVLMQYSLTVTYSSWLVSGRLMLTVFVYYLRPAEISLFACAILLVYVLAAWLFFDYVGACTSSSQIKDASCSKQLAYLDETLQSRRLPLLGAIRMACMILSAMLLVCTLTTHRALAGEGGTLFVSMQLRLSLTFLNIVFFTENSRRQSRALRSSLGHVFTHFEAKRSKTQLDRGKHTMAKKRQVTESGKCRKVAPETSAVGAGESSVQAPHRSCLIQRAKDQAKRVKDLKCFSTFGDRVSSVCHEFETLVSGPLKKLSVVSLACDAAWKGFKLRMQDCWLQGATIGIIVLFASIFCSDRNMVILYSAGFLYTAVSRSASTRLRWRVAPSVLRNGNSSCKPSTGARNQPDETSVYKCRTSTSINPDTPLSDASRQVFQEVPASVSSSGLMLRPCEETAFQEASEHHSTTTGSQIDPGFDNCGLTGAVASIGSDAENCDMMSNAVMEASLRCEPAVGKEVAAPVSSLSWGNLDNLDSKFTEETPLGCDLAIGKAVDASASKQTCDGLKSPVVELTIEVSSGCEPAFGRPFDAPALQESEDGDSESSDVEATAKTSLACKTAASTQSWGDLESSDDEVTEGASLVCETPVAQATTSSASIRWGDLESSDDDCFVASVHAKRRSQMPYVQAGDEIRCHDASHCGWHAATKNSKESDRPAVSRHRKMEDALTQVDYSSRRTYNRNRGQAYQKKW